MSELRPADEYTFVPWKGFPHEEKPLMNGLYLLTGLIVLWGVVMSMLGYLVRIAAASQQFQTIVPTLVDVTAGVFHWGWIVVIALWIWGWERMRTKKYRKVHR